MVNIDIPYLDVKTENVGHMLDFLYLTSSILITNKKQNIFNPPRSNINGKSNYLIYLLACENCGLQNIGEKILTLNT